MFNPMRPDEVILAIGRVLRMAADSAGPSDDYRRSQLLSGYSIARHLAAEEAARAELFIWFRGELISALEDGGPLVLEGRERIGAARDGAELGDALVELLERLGRGEDDERVRKRLRLVFVEMADREVEALARAAQ
jgi:hypothetical protein